MFSYSFYCNAHVAQFHIHGSWARKRVDKGFSRIVHMVRQSENNNSRSTEDPGTEKLRFI